MFRPRLGLTSALLGLVAALIPVIGAWAVEDFDEGAIRQVQHPEWFKDSFLNLRDDADEAREAGKQGIFVFFSTQGCSYCHLFTETSLSDPLIVNRLQAHFDSIGLEIFSDDELTDFAGEQTRVKTFALDQGVQFAPTLLFFDLDGKPLLRLTGYYEPERFSAALDYLIGGHFRQLGLREYLAASQRPTQTEGLLADALFADPPYSLDRSRVPAQRPLLVLFEAAACDRCKRFHDKVLRDRPTRERLASFDVVRLDAADAVTPVLTPAGERTNPKTWFDRFGFTEPPALVFFNETGKQVLATDALVLRNRMNNSIGYVTERAYDKGWNYQRYARSQALKKAAGGVP
ncbi:MAG: thioredoxin fold domain-containing protein [Thiohalocapsa sp.]